MRIHGFAAIAALSLAAAPVAAAAAPMAPLPTAERIGDSTQGSSELSGSTAWILAAIALGLVIWGVIELTNDSDSPTSP